MKIILSIKLLLLLLLCLPVIGNAQEMKINNLGVTPAKPLYEIVGNKAVLNAEMTFENMGQWTLELASWKVKLLYIGMPSVEIPGTQEDFWYNVRLYDLDSGIKDVTDFYAGYFDDDHIYHIGLRQMPRNGRMLFYLPYTVYPVGMTPAGVIVTLTLRDYITLEEKELEFFINPKRHSTKTNYIFPVRSNKLGVGQDWFMGDQVVPLGVLHGSGHELYAGHRRVHRWWDGLDKPVLFNQRYAHDIGVRDASGETHAPFPPGGFKIVESYYAWGQDVIAMAGGKVIDVQKFIGDNPLAGVIDFPAGEGAGNRVIIDHLNGEYSIYAHLMKGSIPDDIFVGATVTQGKLLGKVGNSGNTSEPHLHFTLQDRPIYEKNDSYPIRFSNISIRRDGEPSFNIWTTSLPSGITIRTH
jgi:hypothetical protein